MTLTDRTTLSLRRRTVLGAAFGLALTAVGPAGVANAYADPVDLQVVDRDTGQVLQTWRHDGRVFIAGRPGARYSLRVTNHTDNRILVVLSVDGVNIISGETASYDQRGYIFKPHESYDLSGWRKSTAEIAAFNFAPLPQSYAARTGRPNDVGVIGMAVFNEKPAYEPRVSPPTRWGRIDPFFSRDRAGAPLPAPPPPPAAVPAPAPSAMMAAPSARAAELDAAPLARREEKLGTGHGAVEHDEMTVEPFERATTYPTFIRQIEYDTRDNLILAGVIPKPSPRPRPFPAQPDREGYVPDPPTLR